MLYFTLVTGSGRSAVVTYRRLVQFNAKDSCHRYNPIFSLQDFSALCNSVLRRGGGVGIKVGLELGVWARVRCSALSLYVKLFDA